MGHLSKEPFSEPTCDAANDKFVPCTVLFSQETGGDEVKVDWLMLKPDGDVVDVTNPPMFLDVVDNAEELKLIEFSSVDIACLFCVDCFMSCVVALDENKESPAVVVVVDEIVEFSPVVCVMDTSVVCCDTGIVPFCVAAFVSCTDAMVVSVDRVEVFLTFEVIFADVISMKCVVFPESELAEALDVEEGADG